MKNSEDEAKFPSENPNPVLRVTKNKVLYVNKASARLFSIKEGDKIPKLFQSELTEALKKNILKTSEVEINNLNYIFDIAPVKEEGYVNIYGKDIPERKQMELNLKSKQAELESIFRAAPTGIGVVVDRVLKQVNDRFCELVGYTREELLNKSARMVYPSDEEYEAVGKNKYAQIETSGSGTVETRFKRKDGKIIDILLSSALIDSDQPLVGVTFTALDITRRTITEQKLKKSEEKYRRLIESAQEGIWVIDKDAYTTYVNPRMEEMLGYTQDEMLGKHLFDFMDEKEVSISKRYLERRMLGIEEQHDFEFLRKNGTKIYTLLETSPLTDESGVYNGALAFISDITARKIAEEKLKESEEKYRYFFDNAQVGLFWSRISDGTFLECNDTFAKLVGYNTREECLVDYIAIEHYVNLIDRDEMLEKLNMNGEIKNYKIQVSKRDGTLFWANISARINLRENRIEGVATNITERVILEEKLIEREKSLINAQDIARLGFWDWNVMTGELYWSDEVYRQYGFKPNEVTPTFELFSNIVHPKDREFVQKNVNAALEDNAEYEIDFRIRQHSGKILYIYTKGEVTRDVKGKAARFVGTQIDITERKYTEIELQKSEAIYREAYNRAEFYKDIFTHDINNILQNISNGIQLNEMYLNKPDKSNKVKKNIDIIKKQVRRGANLVSNVRKLSKISESETSLFIVNCCDVLKKSIHYIKNAFQDINIKIELQISENNFKILANELLEDVYDNLLTNSINYNDSEVISIEVKANKELRQGINYIKMQFIDNGIGITDERKHQIFTRGYSEETSVHGMGLGLSLVKKIIESYAGEIWMEDRVKGDYTKGTNCIILIPEVTNNG